MIDLLAPVITLKMCPQFCEEGQVFYFAVWRGMIFAIISRLDLTIVEPFDRNLKHTKTPGDYSKKFGINSGFKETAHLPLPKANILS